ncbi:MAG: class I SAM-dependent methyltransferase [Saprospirales bacterium]|nr:MAG: class I SAM-dependent methyltransferase [Saprospirales bacterium]
MTLYQKWCLKKAEIKAKRLSKFYQPGAKVLDIGSGNGALVKLLREQGLSVTPLDIQNKSAFEEIKPLLYDGGKLPWENLQFDWVQMITVLHHTPNPENIIKEAKRVGKKVLIMEDIYYNVAQKYLTFFADSLNNIEFRGHPHTNKTDLGWKEVFLQNGLKVDKAEFYRFLGIFDQVIYALSKVKEPVS